MILPRQTPKRTEIQMLRATSEILRIFARTLVKDRKTTGCQRLPSFFASTCSPCVFAVTANDSKAGCNCRIQIRCSRSGLGRERDLCISSKRVTFIHYAARTPAHRFCVRAAHSLGARPWTLAACGDLGGPPTRPKAAIHNIWQAEPKNDADNAFDLFIKTYEPKNPKAALGLQKDRTELMAFCDFPAQH